MQERTQDDETGTAPAPRERVRPVIDRNRCEGKAECVKICPEDVFEVRRIDDADFAELGFFGKMKSRAHKRMTAYTPRADACATCGLCVTACPEDAIRLERVEPAARVPRAG